jgi:hypothetical protein
MDPSSGSDADSTGKMELKTKKYVVGAPGFEPGASCTQARRVIFSKSFLCNKVFENKTLAQNIW